MTVRCFAHYAVDLDRCWSRDGGAQPLGLIREDGSPEYKYTCRRAVRWMLYKAQFPWSALAIRATWSLFCAGQPPERERAPGRRPSNGGNERAKGVVKSLPLLFRAQTFEGGLQGMGRPGTR